LARHLGHFPTSRERNVARRRDSDFPGDGAFRRLSKLGPLSTQLVTWCETRPAFGDVVGLASIVAESEPSQERARAGSTRPNGYVYLLKDGRRFKIGHTNSVGRRKSEAMTWLKDPRLVHQIPTDDPEGVERYWHRRFEERHSEREWFLLTQADVAAFKRWRKIF
jgi:hypothetical protein